MSKLLQINVVANSGSTGKIAEQIGAVAMSRGWESYIAYGRWANASKSKLIKIGSKWDVWWHVLLTRLTDRHGLGSKRATRRLIAQIDRIKPDVIHLHNIHGYYVNYEILFKYLNRARIPVIWTLHDCWSFTGHCGYFTYFNCLGWQAECDNCPQIHSYPSTLFHDRSKKNFLLKKSLFNSVGNMTIVPVSQWLGRETSKSFLKSCPITVIPNGIDIEVFNIAKPSDENRIKEKYSIPDGKSILLGVASTWDGRKGLNDFIKLSAVIAGEWQIVLVGLNDRQLKSLPQSIKGIARTENAAELVMLYSVAEVLINPTYEDTYPTTNLEAMACGTPVITYRTGGSPEAVTAETGFVVEQGDIGGVVKAIEEIKQRGRNYYHSTCRKRAEECFDKDKQFEKYIELYDRVLTKDNG